MLTRRLVLTLAALLMSQAGASAQEKLKVVATFSILADFVKNVGGERVAVQSLSGRAAMRTSISRVRAMRKRSPMQGGVRQRARLRGWIARLIKASGTKATPVTATKGIKPRKAADDHGRAHDDADRTPGSRSRMRSFTWRTFAMRSAPPILPGRTPTRRRQRLSRQARCARHRSEGRDR